MVIFIIIFLIILSPFIRSYIGKLFLPLSVKEEHRNCNIDDECIHIDTDCSCSCGDSVNKKFADQYNKTVKKLCNVFPPMELCSIFCNYTNKCISNRCQYAEVSGAELQKQLNNDAPNFIKGR